jgi:selenocysteine-specific elongation factor
MAIIGTAGHVDHGKSALIQALTSIDPDRLPEEKRREMTIDLGFAWLRASSGEMIGIVDVPGHEDFVRNMIVGAGGIDAALLVIAADEGWMPQTEEHLQILDLLHIKHGIVALNKVDLIDDPGWLDLIEEEIREKLKGTALCDALIIRVSATKETNIGELRQRLEELVSKVIPKGDVGKPRLPIDRIFTMKGSGVVVTGTLIDGALARGDKVYIFPKKLRTYIRTLESYKEKKDRVEPGTRVAVNLVGLEKEDLSRGDVIFGGEGQVKASKFIDVSIKLVPQLSHPVKSNTEFKIYLGTKEIPGGDYWRWHCT